VAGLATPAYAQETPPALEEIVVTAERRAENLQKVGIAVSAFSGEQIADLNLASSNELATLVPNLDIAEPFGAGNQPAIFIRGIGLADFATNNSGPVGVYVDDLYISSPSAQVFQVFDLERVEVLRGPQGTLYGRNTTGGAIKYLSARPTEALFAEFRGQYAEYDTSRLEGAVSGPLREGLRGRLAVVKEDSNGYMHNVVDGSDRTGSDTLAFRGLLEGDLTDRLSFTAALYGGIVDGPAASYRRQGVMQADGATPCSVADARAGRCYDFFVFPTERDFYDVSENRKPTLDVENYAGALTLRWQGEAVTVQSVTGLQYLDKHNFEETDVNPIDFLNLDYEVDSHTFTEELHFTGATDRMQWIAGVFYLDETLDQDQTADIGREFRPVIESIDPVLYPGGFDPAASAIGVPAFFGRVRSAQELESWAVFGQVNYSLTDALDVVFGLRYTDEEKTFDQRVDLEEPTFTAPLYDYRDSIQDDNLSGKVAIEYSPTDDLFVYGSIATGFKAGGYNGGFLFDVNQQQPFDPETITTYELGLKSTWLDGRLRANAAAFYNDYQDMQLFRIEAGAGLIPLQILDNAGEANTWGLELELAAVPFEGFDVQLSLGYLETDLAKYVTDAGADLSGNDLAQSPKLSGFAYFDYERPLGESLTFLSELSFSFKDDAYFTADNNPILRQDAYWLANLRLGIGGATGHWRLAFFCTNLFDEEYLVHGFDLSPTLGSNQLFLGRPRTAGVELVLRL
jgi:iron complex outermembrane receptor protein